MSYIEKLRQKSDATKMRITLGGALVITIGIVFLWLLGSGFIFPQVPGSGEKPEGLFKVLFGSEKDTKRTINTSGTDEIQVTPVSSPTGTSVDTESTTDVFGGEQVFIEEQGSAP